MSFVGIDLEGKQVIDPAEAEKPDVPKIWYDPKVIEMMWDYSKPTYQYTSHLKPAVDTKHRAMMIAKCLDALKPHDFDTFAFSGLSGAAVGFVLAYLMEKEIIVVRKPREYTRAGSYEVQGYMKAKRYMIVDDLISTGTTAGRVIRGVDSIAPQAKLIGVLTYAGVPSVITDNGEDPGTWDAILRHSREQEIA